MNPDEMIEEESEVIELKDNFLPIGLTPLEDIFDSNDIPRKPKMQPLNEEIEDWSFEGCISDVSSTVGSSGSKFISTGSSVITGLSFFSLVV